MRRRDSLAVGRDGLDGSYRRIDENLRHMFCFAFSHSFKRLLLIPWLRQITVWFSERGRTRTKKKLCWRQSVLRQEWLMNYQMSANKKGTENKELSCLYIVWNIDRNYLYGGSGVEGWSELGFCSTSFDNSELCWIFDVLFSYISRSSSCLLSMITSKDPDIVIVSN